MRSSLFFFFSVRVPRRRFRVLFVWQLFVFDCAVPFIFLQPGGLLAFWRMIMSARVVLYLSYIYLLFLIWCLFCLIFFSFFVWFFFLFLFIPSIFFLLFQSQLIWSLLFLGFWIRFLRPFDIWVLAFKTQQIHQHYIIFFPLPRLPVRKV